MPRAEPLPRMTLRFRQPEIDALTKAAADAGLPPASYCTALVRAGVGLPFDPGTRLKSEITRLTDELRRIGVNLNQVARALNEARAVRDEDVMEAVATLIEVVEQTRAEYRGLLASTRENIRLRLPDAIQKGRRRPK